MSGSEFRKRLCEWTTRKDCIAVVLDSNYPSNGGNSVLTRHDGCIGYYAALRKYDPVTDLFNGSIPASTVEGIGPKYD